MSENTNLANSVITTPRTGIKTADDLIAKALAGGLNVTVQSVDRTSSTLHTVDVSYQVPQPLKNTGLGQCYTADHLTLVWIKDHRKSARGRIVEAVWWQLTQHTDLKILKRAAHHVDSMITDAAELRKKYAADTPDAPHDRTATEKPAPHPTMDRARTLLTDAGHTEHADGKEGFRLLPHTHSSAVRLHAYYANGDTWHEVLRDQYPTLFKAARWDVTRCVTFQGGCLVLTPPADTDTVEIDTPGCVPTGNASKMTEHVRALRAGWNGVVVAEGSYSVYVGERHALAWLSGRGFTAETVRESVREGTERGLVVRSCGGGVIQVGYRWWEPEGADAGAEPVGRVPLHLMVHQGVEQVLSASAVQIVMGHADRSWAERRGQARGWVRADVVRYVVQEVRGARLERVALLTVDDVLDRVADALEAEGCSVAGLPEGAPGHGGVVISGAGFSQVLLMPSSAEGEQRMLEAVCAAESAQEREEAAREEAAAMKAVVGLTVTVTEELTGLRGARPYKLRVTEAGVTGKGTGVVHLRGDKLRMDGSPTRERRGSASAVLLPGWEAMLGLTGEGDQS